MLRPVLLVLTLFILSACHNNTPTPNKAPIETLLIAPEDTITLHTDAFATGPTVSGSIQPKKKPIYALKLLRWYYTF